MESHGHVIYRESPYQERVYQLYDFIGQLSSIEKGALVISVCAFIILVFLFFLLCLDAFVFKTGLARCHQLFPKRQSASRGLVTPGVAPDVGFFSVPVSVNGIVPSPFSPVTLTTAVFKTQVLRSASPEVSTADPTSEAPVATVSESDSRGQVQMSNVTTAEVHQKLPEVTGSSTNESSAERVTTSEHDIGAKLNNHRSDHAVTSSTQTDESEL